VDTDLTTSPFEVAQRIAVGRQAENPGPGEVAGGAAPGADDREEAVYPVVLGAGLPVFGGVERPIDLELVEAKRLAGGGVTRRV
jgi:hypothetical protein